MYVPPYRHELSEKLQYLYTKDTKDQDIQPQNPMPQMQASPMPLLQAGPMPVLQAGPMPVLQQGRYWNTMHVHTTN